MAPASGSNLTDAVNVVNCFICDDTDARELAAIKAGEEDEGHDNSGSLSREGSATGSTGSMTRTGYTEDADAHDSKHDLHSSPDSSKEQSSNLSSPSAATCGRSHPREFSIHREQCSVEVLEEPRAPDLRFGQRSMGSAEHDEGKCRPCAWFWKPQGCRNAEECRHCHACGPGELKARKQRKVAELRRLAAIQKAAEGEDITTTPGTCDPSAFGERARRTSPEGHTSAGQLSGALGPNPIEAAWAPSQGQFMGAPDMDCFTLPWCSTEVGSGARSSRQILQLQRPQFSIAVPSGTEGQPMMVATTRTPDVMTPWPGTGSMFPQGLKLERMRRYSCFR